MAIRQKATAVKNPTPFVIPSPVGIDSVITNLQTAFSVNLTWLEKSFGKATKMYHKQDDGAGGEIDVFYPGVWNGQFKDPLMLLASDNWDSYTFSIASAVSVPIDYEGHGVNRYQKEMAVIFWFNLPKIDSTKTFDFTDELVLEIEKVIRSTNFDSNNGVEILGSTTDPEEIFEEFTVDLVKDQKLIYPYRGCRFNLLAFYQSLENC